MNTILLFIEKYLVKPMERISAQRHIAAVRNGLLAVFPLSLIGSLFYLVTILPLPESWPIQQFIATHTNTILVPYRMTVVLITLYMVVGVGANLAKSYKYNQLAGALVSLVAFLMTIVPTQPAAMVPEAFLQSAAELGLDIGWMKELRSLDWVMPQMLMSGTSTYVGAFSAILGVEAMHLSNHLFRSVRQSSFWKKTQIPSSVVQTVDTLFPIFLVVTLMFIVRVVIGFDFQSVTMALVGSLIRSSSTMAGSLVYVFVISFFCFLGIIGYSVPGSAAGVAWSILLRANRMAHAVGNLPPNVAPLPFFHYFVWIGGIGATLSLTVLMCFSRSSYLKKLGISCLAPSLLNMNQPALYGTPVILNPYMFIPFILGPQVATLFSYLFMQINWVGRPYASPSNSLPFFIGAYFSTGDGRAVLLAIINFFICLVIYYPFFKAYEKKIIADGERKAKQYALDKKHQLKATPVE